MAEKAGGKAPKSKITIALSGNPNAGKTTVFNAVTGARQHIANYPGVTVEKKVGKAIHKGVEIKVVDLPGAYSLTAYSLEEIVARDFLVNERPDVVVDIVDASNLERNLYLAVQFKELGVPLILALNMMDMASNRGIVIDSQMLASMLGVPVVPMVARTRKGLESLLDAIVETTADSGRKWAPETVSYGADIDESLKEIEEILRAGTLGQEKYPTGWLALKCIEGDSQIIDYVKQDRETSRRVEAVCERTSRHLMSTLEEEPEGLIADHRYGYIAGIVKKAVKRKIESRLNLSDKIDRVLTNRVLGPLIMMAVLYGIYEFTFWGSETPVKWVEGFFGWLRGETIAFMPEGRLRSLITAGLIDGVGGVLGFVPLIMFMFLAIALMEDSGYMARVAYMLDRVLSWFGLHGNSVIALIVSGGISGGCAVPGILAARTLRDPKERIATLLVVPFMNCGAKLPLFGLLIAAFFFKDRAAMLFVFTLLSWAIALFAAKLIRSTVLRGPKTPFVMELPPYRLPTIQGVFIHTWERTWQYVKKAGTVILGIAIFLWAVMTFPDLPQERAHVYEEQMAENRDAFLASDPARGWIKSERDLEVLNEQFRSGARDQTAVSGSRSLHAIARTARRLEEGKKAISGQSREAVAAAVAYLEYRENRARIEARKQEEALRGTIAGRVGRTLEHATGALGFNYKINIALLGGFAAKEVIVSTLGTAYALGDAEFEKGDSLPQRLRNDPNWNPLVAFCLILFTMLYVPCFVATSVIMRESSWKWAGFSLMFNLATAYVVTLAVYQTASLLRLGL